MTRPLVLMKQLGRFGLWALGIGECLGALYGLAAMFIYGYSPAGIGGLGLVVLSLIFAVPTGAALLRVEFFNGAEPARMFMREVGESHGSHFS